MLQYFKGSLLFTLVCLALTVVYGWTRFGTLAGTAELTWIVLVLAVLEISLSFDNAVVNAAVLKDLDPVWQQRFLTWGMAFAVFGMRIAFPLAIVAIAAGIGPVEALQLSLDDPVRYEAIVSGAQVGIAGFGGAFLALVGMRFFFDADKDIHWIRWIEQRLSAVSSIHSAEIALLLLALWGVSRLLAPADALVFLSAGIFGMVAFIAVEAVGTLLELREAARAAAGAVLRSGLGGFLYLNLLDASFSFDGVIGAFALSNNMVVIALGLSIGAMFVRSLTIMLVRRNLLEQYRFLEHGAFWAIVVLAAIMLLSARFHIPETFTGLVGGGLIAASLAWSVRWRRRHPRP